MTVDPSPQYSAHHNLSICCHGNHVASLLLHPPSHTLPSQTHLGFTGEHVEHVAVERVLGVEVLALRSACD